MREIKFRAVVIDDDGNKRLEYNVWPCGDKTVYVENGGFYMVPERVEQFTGLLDKNGKEIYEGDIVMLSNKFTYTVSFEDGKFVCYHAAQTNSMKGLKWGDLHRALDPDFSDYDFRVIGNIYSNPELL